MLQVTLTHETTLKQVYGGGGGTSETRANDVCSKKSRKAEEVAVGVKNGTRSWSEWQL